MCCMQKKLLLHTRQARPLIVVPTYKEFKVDILIDILKETAGWDYFPEIDLSERKPDRQFVVLLLSTFAREFLIEIVNHANA